MVVNFLVKSVKKQWVKSTMQYATTYVMNGYTFPVIVYIKKTYKLLQGSSTKWFCTNSTKEEIPFISQTNQELEKIYSGKHIIPYCKLYKNENNLYNKLCQAKDTERKEELHKLYIAYKNHVTNLSRRSKESYFKNLFEKDKKNTYEI